MVRGSANKVIVDKIRGSFSVILFIDANIGDLFIDRIELNRMFI